MAGYKRKRTIYRLKFEDPEMEGLEVDVTGGALADFAAFAQFSELSFTDISQLTAEKVKEVNDAVVEAKTLFAKHLVAWNLEDDDDTPVPATLEGVMSQDDEFILAIVNAWLDAVGGVSGPKEPTSNGGSPSLVASIPMEPLSASPSILSTPSLSLAAVSGSGAYQAS